MTIIGITGTIGAGKGTIVDYLVRNKNFKHYSVRNYLLDVIKQRQIPVNRDSMVMVANELREKNGNSFIIEQLVKSATRANQNAVIESIRHPGEISALKKHPSFYLFSIDADIKIRYERIIKRGSETDQLNFEKFKQNEEREMSSENPSAQNIKECIDGADYFFNNNGDIESLFKQIEAVLTTILRQDK